MRDLTMAHLPYPDETTPEGGGEAFVILDDHGVITACGEATSALLGYSVEELLNRKATTLLAGEVPAAARRGFRQRRPWSASVRVRGGNGAEVQLRLQAYPLSSVRHRAGWFLRAESAATAPAHERPDLGVLKQWAWDQLAIPVAVCESEGRLVAVNAETSNVTGLSRAELLGAGIEKLLPGSTPGVPDELARAAAHVLRSGETARHTAAARSADTGQERIWSVVLSPLSGPGHAVQALCAAFVDVTQQSRARHRLALVNDAGDRVGRSLDVTETAQELANVGVEFADFVTVDLLDAVLDGDELDPTLPVGRPLLFRRVAQQSVLDGCPESVIAVGQAHAHSEDSPPGRSLRGGEAYRREMEAPEVHRWLEQLPARKQSASEFGLHSIMGVPLTARGTTLGIVQFFRHRTELPFDGDDLLLAREIAARAYVCVDNARRYTREHATALTLQRDLLPDFPHRHAAVEATSRYLPASAGVGGDWLDVIPLSGARVALVAGDVVGHGIAAAATMGRLSTAVRTLADMDLPPEELLTHLDDLVINLGRPYETARHGVPTPAGQGTTCLYAVYDPVSAMCEIARAGHPPPALVTPDGLVAFPELPQGPPLGLGGYPFESVRIPVPDGSLLALYTNGLLGDAGSDLDVGMSALRNALHRHTGSLEQTCDSVVASVVQTRSGDDIALLLARTRVLDPRQVSEWSVRADPAAVGEVRRKVAATLAAWGLEHLVFATELIASELVTNAIRYGTGPLRLRLIKEASLTCEVSDGSSAVPRVRRARMLDEGGRGLMVISQIADRWGSRHSDEGKIIWTEQFLTEDAAETRDSEA